nr:MAG TPA: hypothetical protein [Caudoviricetes sp.]
MKLYFPIFRKIAFIIFCIIPVCQQYYWFTHLPMAVFQAILAVTWFFINLCIASVFSVALFPRQTKQRHKFFCTFYGFKNSHTRICTRTYESIWKYCFKQLFRTKSLYFKIQQLDSK